MVPAEIYWNDAHFKRDDSKTVFPLQVFIVSMSGIFSKIQPNKPPGFLRNQRDQQPKCPQMQQPNWGLQSVSSSMNAYACCQTGVALMMQVGRGLLGRSWHSQIAIVDGWFRNPKATVLDGAKTL